MVTVALQCSELFSRTHPDYQGTCQQRQWRNSICTKTLLQVKFDKNQYFGQTRQLTFSKKSIIVFSLCCTALASSRGKVDIDVGGNSYPNNVVGFVRQFVGAVCLVLSIRTRVAAPSNPCNWRASGIEVGGHAAGAVSTKHAQSVSASFAHYTEQQWHNHFQSLPFLRLLCKLPELCN